MKVQAIFEGSDMALVLHAEGEAEQRMVGAFLTEAGCTAEVRVLHDGHVTNNRIRSVSVVIKPMSHEPS